MSYQYDNIFYFKFIKSLSSLKPNKDYFIEIYCNNNNYFDLLTNNKSIVTFKYVSVPIYIKYIHIRITNVKTNKLYTYNVNNIATNIKLILDDDDIIYVFIKNKIGLNVDISNTNKYINDNINKYVYHRELKTLVPEIRNNFYGHINKFISNNDYFPQNNVAKNLRKILTNIIVWFLNSKISSYHINSFVSFYNINIKQFQTPIQYNSFNDFFKRELSIQPYTTSTTNNFRAPVTGRIVAFDIYNNYNKTSIWIKGKNFTINKLIDDNTDTIYNIFICRLTIQDYHHIHMPYTGKLLDIKIIGDDYYGVSSDIVNSSNDVFTENYRNIYKFLGIHDNSEFIFWVIPIGSFVVNSIVHNMTIGNTYNSGQKIGNFDLGGSTVVILTTKKINVDKDIEYYSDNKIESYVSVGDKIGNLNISNYNDTIQFPIYFAINKPNKFISVNYFIIKLIQILIIILFIIVLIKMIKNKTKQYSI